MTGQEEFRQESWYDSHPYASHVSELMLRPQFYFIIRLEWWIVVFVVDYMVMTKATVVI